MCGCFRRAKLKHKLFVVSWLDSTMWMTGLITGENYTRWTKTKTELSGGTNNMQNIFFSCLQNIQKSIYFYILDVAVDWIF